MISAEDLSLQVIYLFLYVTKKQRETERSSSFISNDPKKLLRRGDAKLLYLQIQCTTQSSEAFLASQKLVLLKTSMTAFTRPNPKFSLNFEKFYQISKCLRLGCFIFWEGTVHCDLPFQEQWHLSDFLGFDKHFVVISVLRFDKLELLFLLAPSSSFMEFDTIYTSHSPIGKRQAELNRGMYKANCMRYTFQSKNRGKFH